ncbi:MAG: 4-hydroxy-3-methylbut-2-enyl diphosphate reductase [Candidatus Zixiibacteriota bacterium]|nr:MAG: 4-hydroxy-3-methylbut-2-enyl diphosphate reductase [candidate division Zixibacteria bacterium]
MIKEIHIARSYGFCMGVKRAITIAEETARTATENVTILNEIVHNEAVVERFRREGVGQAFSVDEVQDGTLIISAHGVAPDVKAAAQERGLKVIDATCPLVEVIYDIVKKVVAEGYYVIHFGEPDHDETKGVVGHAPDRITVIPPGTSLDDYPDWTDRKLALTVQTTSHLEDSLAFQQAALKKWPHLEVHDTICNATNKRQSAIMELAPRMDMVLVVGSNTSANSKRLARIADSLCGKGYLISSDLDIKEDWFDDTVEKVGISAGASTPEFLVEAVIRKLQRLSGGQATIIKQPKAPRRKRAAMTAATPQQ